MLGLPPPSDDTLFQARESVTAQETEDEDDEDDLYVTDKRPSAKSPSPSVSETSPSKPSRYPQGIDRLAPYANHIVEPSTTLPPKKVTFQGREDTIANMAAKNRAWRAQRKEKGAAKKAAKGKGMKLARLHREALWVS